VFPELAADQILRASVAATSSWDSINAVVLVSVVEEEFGLEIPAEDLGRLSSFQAILDYLVERAG
jgi:acyl carrier protein